MRFDAASAQCLVFTRAEGVLAAFAHDLKLRVERFTAVVDDRNGCVAAELDAASLRVICAMRGDDEAPGVLGDGDLETIAATIRRDVLEVDRHPTIRFRSTGLVLATDGGDDDAWAGASPDAALRIDGTLELH